jgi:beta-galactosidase
MTKTVSGCALLSLLLFAAPEGRGERSVVSLDGSWQFQLDPQGEGRTQQWFGTRVSFTNTIRVPGAWQAQGFGTESDKLRHSYVGKAWYKRQLDLPKIGPGQRVFLCFGGVHRSAEIWVDSVLLGDHVGYLSPFEFELTRMAATNSTATLAVCVDCDQHWELDCLTGCTDIIDEMFTPWGGICGHVSLETRSAVWLEGVFLQSRVSPPAVAVLGKIEGEKGMNCEIRLRVRSRRGGLLGLASTRIAAGTELRLETELPGAKLWSPESPELCLVRLELLRAESAGPAHNQPGELLDSQEIPFGLREIRIRGSDFFLNNRKLYLRGYGDDAIYPQTMAPPTDVAFYRDRLRVAREYGFNFVRHHSHFLSPEYYTAADEVGMLISPELPIAYETYYEKAKGRALGLYRTEWSAVIKRLRNHPSIFDWCMGNEMWNSFPLAPDLYELAKNFDPTRPVIDSDGVWADAFLQRPTDRRTLDFFPVLFDEFNLPFDKPAKHKFGVSPAKPVLSHETGNYVTVPRLDLIDQFSDNFKPFWLLPFREKLQRSGLLAEASQWSLNSERLYCLAHKLNLEDMRKNPRISGYMWWLLQDYWTGSNGLLDTYRRPKSIAPEQVRQFNGPVVLLQEGLGSTCSARHQVKVKFLTSNYSPYPIDKATLVWSIKLGTTVVAKGRKERVHLDQGELATVAEIEALVPAISGPEKLWVSAELKDRQVRCQNQWYAWAYPDSAELSRHHGSYVPLYAPEHLWPMLSRFEPRPLPENPPLPARAVYVVDQATPPMLDAVEAGASLLCLAPGEIFPSVPNRFKPAWWLGSENDCNAGTVVYRHPATDAVAPEGWCDLGWYKMLEGGQAMLLDEFPAKPAVLVRGLDVHTVCRDKALLFEASVGHGSMIVSGLRLDPDPAAPERAWLLGRLISHASALPHPKAALPVSFLKARITRAAPPEGPYAAGFSRILSTDCEQAEYPSYREAAARLFVCRQLAPDVQLEWETATAPSNSSSPKVTFVFAGGLGWKSQPSTEGLALSVDGREAVSFDIASTRQVWSNRVGSVQLCFIPKKHLPEDALGVFYLTLRSGQFEPGMPCRLTVRSKGKDSRRWFGLNPYSMSWP